MSKLFHKFIRLVLPTKWLLQELEHRGHDYAHITTSSGTIKMLAIEPRQL